MISGSSSEAQVVPDLPAAIAPPAKPLGRAPRSPIVRYLGFRTTAQGREYTLGVSDGLEWRQFVLLITHAAFAARDARFQDAPDLCSGKLRRELVAHPDLVPGPSFAVTAQDLLEYREARDQRAPVNKRRRPAG